MQEPEVERKLFKVFGELDRLHFGVNPCITREPWPFFDTSGSDIVIGDNVQISSGVYVHTHSHQFGKKEWRDLPKVVNRAPTIIENDVFLGVNAQIMHTCKNIGSHSVIAAGSIVTKDVPACEIWAGNPAVKIGDIT